VDDEIKAILAKRDENLCRKELTVIEQTNLGRALEARLAQEAKQRQRMHGGTSPGPGACARQPGRQWGRPLARQFGEVSLAVIIRQRSPGT
jgi:hypothetical protein